MSEKTDKFEQDIVSIINNSTNLPTVLPNWMINEGIVPGARILDASHICSSGSKTDVIIRIENSEDIKISAKLSSADYFGNWYSHTRLINEFGEQAFNKLVLSCTNWANMWKHNPAASIFVGVSICFGKRSGNTACEFTDVFNYDDIVKIVAGYGSGEHIANSLYVSSKVPTNFNQLLENLAPIDEQTILELSSNFKIAFRPINPMTEGTNRGKCVYTQFQPHTKLKNPTTVTRLSDLNSLGFYVPVEANSLNHNRLLNDLEQNWNLIIPRK
ncbi:hypothetical protein NXZ75_22000 [Lysinibacillus sphaericus]|uniref:hypothetical protein n=1 Tax=Lysinibacillus sphaericus TaxID=1421 RepID=UPI0021626CFD|nr:hypothetical protein [Lysinibacillus sphaericus]MCS1384831.1 hypothetical protein [Lysinibacillus sphaericus]